MSKQKIKAIILAAGSGERFSEGTPKQFVKLAGLPVLVHTLKTFELCRKIDEIIIVTLGAYVETSWQIVKEYQISKVKKIVIGGDTRQESSKIGIDCCGVDTNYVLIHDAVRCFLSPSILDDIIDAVQKYGAVDTVIPTADTIVEVDATGFIKGIPDRSILRRGQTPQAFEYNLIREAHERAIKEGLSASTDDCALVLRKGEKVYTVPGDEKNIKITYPIDLHIADKLFQLRKQSVNGFEQEIVQKMFFGKTFIIAGGASGIGEAISEILSGLKGINVFALSRRSDPRLDIKDPATIEKALEFIKHKTGHIDYAINCAGILIRKPVEFTDVEEWDDVFDTNLKGSFMLARALIPYFKLQNHGSLTFVGSSSYTRGRSGYSAYSSSKAALVNFCQALAEEVCEYNISVNIVSPSRVKTPLRYKNFGKEDPQTLLSPKYVAEKIIMSLLIQTTGSVFEINGHDDTGTAG